MKAATWVVGVLCIVVAASVPVLLLVGIWSFDIRFCLTALVALILRSSLRDPFKLLAEKGVASRGLMGWHAK